MDPQTLPTLRVPNEHLSPFLPGQSRFRATFARTVKVTLKTTLTSSQNMHPPPKRKATPRLSWLRVPPFSYAAPCTCATRTARRGSKPV